MSLAILAPLTAGYMAMAPTFEALFAPSAFRGDFARLSVSLAPGFFAYCALMSTCNPVFQLAHRTWPLTLAAIAALMVNLALLWTARFSSDIDGVARAFSISLWAGLAIAAISAFGFSRVRPSLRDILVVAVAALAMALAVWPLNGVHPRFLAAVLALAVGGAIYGGALLIFDVSGARGLKAGLGELARRVSLSARRGMGGAEREHSR